MYLADYHIHSRISPDAGDSMTALAEAGLAAGAAGGCLFRHRGAKVFQRKRF